jgi:hypothetical protein
MSDWVGRLLITLIILLFIGAGITFDIWKWHKTEEVIGHKMGYWEYHFLFGGGSKRK